MFGEQAIRLLRERWPNATMLAEELFSMFQNDIPLAHDAPITLNNFASELPALKINTNDNPAAPPPIQITGHDGTSVSINVSGGNITFTNNNTNQTTNITEIKVKADRTSFVGTVSGGSGSVYTVVLDTGKTVTALVPGIVSTETIPTGATGVVVLDSSKTYQLIYPLWIT